MLHHQPIQTFPCPFLSRQSQRSYMRYTFCTRRCEWRRCCCRRLLQQQHAPLSKTPLPHTHTVTCHSHSNGPIRRSRSPQQQSPSSAPLTTPSPRGTLPHPFQIYAKAVFLTHWAACCAGSSRSTTHPVQKRSSGAAGMMHFVHKIPSKSSPAHLQSIQTL